LWPELLSCQRGPNYGFAIIEKSTSVSRETLCTLIERPRTDGGGYERPRRLGRGHAAAALFHHFVLRDEVLESMAPVIAMARPKQELATSHIVPVTLSGNKCDQLAVLLARRGNSDEPTKRHDAPDTSGISQSSL